MRIKICIFKNLKQKLTRFFIFFYINFVLILSFFLLAFFFILSQNLFDLLLSLGSKLGWQVVFFFELILLLRSFTFCYKKLPSEIVDGASLRFINETFGICEKIDKQFYEFLYSSNSFSLYSFMLISSLGLINSTI